MSRLDSFIRRLVAQREILDMICLEMPLRDGVVIELGLGNGRTYDHLRDRLGDRRIIAFDRVLAAHMGSTPEPADLVLGEIDVTARDFFGIGAAFVHADIGSGYDDLDLVNLAWLPEVTLELLGPSGLAASGVRMDHPGLAPLPLPPSVAEGRYYIYRKR